MKFKRKCPTCHKKATKRIGKLDFCDDCAKQVRKHRSKIVVEEKYLFSIASDCKIYRDTFIKVY